MLSRNIGGNTSPSVRRVIYYRLQREGHRERVARVRSGSVARVRRGSGGARGHVRTSLRYWL